TLAAGAQATAELVESGDHKVLKLGIPKGQDGSGSGDMSKSVYDANGNGAVDNAEKLGGHAASYFSPATHNHDGVYQPAGTYATPDDVSGAVSGHNSAGNAHSALFNNKQTAPSLASSLPASGTALTANTIYAVADAVGTYAFTPPATGWAHGMFTTGGTVSVSFSGTFVGAAPTVEASKAYEFDVFDGVWAVQEVVSA
ncbi:MAG: hypothetical protein KIG30_08320, partial [Eubacteriales bacterium]|nr:hypothetical protein [Eubacteriales bacterium]